MKLFLHNTLTRQREEFVPLDTAHVKMYVCGPTVYDLAHLGNAVPVVFFDVLYRVLKQLYPKVTYARNITDIDDKIIERSAETGEPIAALTARTEADYVADMAAIGCLPPTITPHATQHIAEMIALIEMLMAKGHAYVVTSDEGNQVLFHVPSMANYGRLSRHKRDDLIAGARVDVASYKKDPADFTLWKPSSAAQPGWESPWGRGRPGWHIECSAMSAKHLGITFDIHAGGNDLIFPHHENEIAQSECAHGAVMANYWLHNGHLTVGGKKMSKSLGNFFTVRELIAEAPAEALRFAMLKSHYRSPIEFSRAAFAESKADLDRLYRRAKPSAHGKVNAKVLEALCQDLNTPLALSELHATADEDLVPTAALLGLLQQQPDEWFKWQPAGSGLTEATIAAQIAARAAAKAAKDYALADKIRTDLLAAGIVLEDTAHSTTWRRG